MNTPKMTEADLAAVLGTLEAGPAVTLTPEEAADLIPRPVGPFRLLREAARGWWYHAELRKQGNATEARRREHESCRGRVQNIREALAGGGFLSIGRGGWSLHYAPNATLSGYGNDFPRACILAGVPTIDTRTIPDEHIIHTIRFPMIAPGLLAGQVDRCPEPSAVLAAGVEGAYAGLLALNQAHRRTTRAPGPLDSAALEDVAPMYEALGATLHNIPQEVPPMRHA